jgi:hypothetical protein
LFRGTVELNEANVAALQALRENPDVQFRVCPPVKKHKSGYSALYMELDVSGCTVELQAVSSLDTSEQSHLWYELRRITEWDAVGLFYRRQLKHSDASCFIEETHNSVPAGSSLSTVDHGTRYSPDPKATSSSSSPSTMD